MRARRTTKNTMPSLTRARRRGIVAARGRSNEFTQTLTSMTSSNASGVAAAATIHPLTLETTQMSRSGFQIMPAKEGCSFSHRQQHDTASLTLHVREADRKEDDGARV
jgi:hypothetical protein